MLLGDEQHRLNLGDKEESVKALLQSVSISHYQTERNSLTYKVKKKDEIWYTSAA